MWGHSLFPQSFRLQSSLGEQNFLGRCEIWRLCYTLQWSGRCRAGVYTALYSGQKDVRSGVYATPHSGQEDVRSGIYIALYSGQKDMRSGIYTALHSGQEAPALWNILTVVSLILFAFN